MVLDQNYPPDARVRKQTKTLLNAGHCVDLLCITGESGPDQINDVVIERFERPSIQLTSSGLKRAWDSLIKNEYQTIRNKIQTLNPNSYDVVHVHDLPLAKTVLSSCDLPVILDLHENYMEAIYFHRAKKDWFDTIRKPKSFVSRMFKPAPRYRREQIYAMVEAEHVLTPVPEAKEEYCKMNVPKDDITVVSNTVDLEWFDKLDRNGDSTLIDDFVIVYVGTLSGPHRGLDTAINALTTVQETIPNAKLVFAGGGGLYLEKTKKLVSRSPLKDDIQFTGWIDETKFRKYMEHSNIGIIPHKSNPHTNTTVPHKLFQYMAAELPIAVTDTKAVGRITNEAQAGAISPPDDPEEFAEAIIRASEMANASENGRKAVEDKYNWEIDGKRLLQVYEEISI